MTLLTAVMSNANHLSLGWEGIFMRLLCAMIVGLVIGTEREYTHRPAGMRTHILVALGACAVSITGQLLFNEYAAFGATPDPARLSAQVITGVGFLGAGTILRDGANVKGLTTAASLWSVACLGIAAGYGYYIIALLGMVFILVTLTFFELLQHKLIKPKPVHDYELETTNISSALQTVDSLSVTYKCQISKMRVEEISNGHRIIFHGEFPRKKKLEKSFFEALAASEYIRMVTIDKEHLFL